MKPIVGKLIEIGLLNMGRGLKLESEGEIIELYGLCKEECKELAPHLDESITISIGLTKNFTPE